MDAPPLTPLAAALLRVPAPERALAIGADGEAALLLAREFPSARVRGLERSEELAAAASVRVGLDPEGRIAFRAGSPRALPFPADHFDLVAQVDGRPHPGAAARVLRAGGHLVFAQTRPSSLAPGLRARWRRAALRRSGFYIVRAERAGDGDFLVARRD